jgi:hypothetical protein
MGRSFGMAALAVALSMLLSWPGEAGAGIVVRVDKASQRMSVIVNG